MAEAKRGDLYEHEEGKYSVICMAVDWDNTSNSYVVLHSESTGRNLIVPEADFFRTVGVDENGEPKRVFKYVR